MDKAWKKEIEEGSIPVGPGGITTSKGEMVPTLAGAETLLASTMGFNSNTGYSVNTNPTFSLIKGFKFSNSGIFL